MRLCRNVKWPLLGVMTIALMTAVYEQLRFSYWPGMPDLDSNDSGYLAFRLSVFALSLILSMRLGRAYDRWCGLGGSRMAQRGLAAQGGRAGHAGHAGMEGSGVLTWLHSPAPDLQVAGAPGHWQLL